MTQTIFHKIVAGEIPSKKVYEDDDFLAILDINPVNDGHVLLLPKIHSETFLDASEEVLQKALPLLKKLGNAIKKATRCHMVTLAAIGEDVAYLHFHLIPRFKDDGVLRVVHRGNKDNLDELQELITKHL